MTTAGFLAGGGQWREPREAHRGRGHGHAILSAVMDEVIVDTGPRGSTVLLRRHLDGTP